MEEKILELFIKVGTDQALAKIREKGELTKEDALILFVKDQQLKIEELEKRIDSISG